MYLDEEHGQVPLDVTIAPLNKTTLLVEWDNIPNYVNMRYEFALSIGQDYQETLEVTGSSLVLDLEEQECQPFQIKISMPGNCDDLVMTGSLLIGERNLNDQPPMLCSCTQDLSLSPYYRSPIPNG